MPPFGIRVSCEHIGQAIIADADKIELDKVE
jgi:hypothetical protein